MRQAGPDTPIYSIGVVGRLTGLTARQIRYYEQVGLLPLHPLDQHVDLRKRLERSLRQSKEENG